LENDILEIYVEKYYMADGNGGFNSGEMRSATFIAQLATAGFLILGMFGLWWQTADPKARLERIEDIINAERKEFLTNYVSLREHIDLIKRLEENFSLIKTTESTLLSKAEFAAWKIERDKYVDGIVNQLLSVQKELTDYKSYIGYTKEAASFHFSEERQYNEDVRARIDKLYGLYQDLLSSQLQIRNSQHPQK
jgi:hypothetical protein